VNEPELIETEGLTLDLQRDGASALLVQVRGEVDIANAEFFANQLRRLQETEQEVIVDLADLEFIDSIGLTQLLTVHRRDDGEARMRLRNVRGQPAQIIELTRLDRILQIEDRDLSV
jgi:anti-anti-sigma factor